MPKHSSYQKLALVYALNGFGGDYNKSREEARTLYIFREFIDNQMILLQNRIDFQSSHNRERNPEDVYHRQEMDPLRTALDNFAKACNALNQDYHQHLNDLPSTKAKLDEAAAAAEALEKEYNKYKQLHPEMIRGYEEASNFDEIWTNDIYESIGDNVLKANGYRIPEYPAADAPQAGDPKPVPLPPDTSYQQLATHISAGISPEGKAFDDAETLVRFNQGLYNQYSQYQQEKIKANQENRDTTLLDKKMQAVSVL